MAKHFHSNTQTSVCKTGQVQRETDHHEGLSKGEEGGSGKGSGQRAREPGVGGHRAGTCWKGPPGGRQEVHCSTESYRAQDHTRDGASTRGGDTAPSRARDPRGHYPKPDRLRESCQEPCLRRRSRTKPERPHHVPWQRVTLRDRRRRVPGGRSCLTFGRRPATLTASASAKDRVRGAQAHARSRANVQP